MPASVLVSIGLIISACAGATSGRDVRADWGRVPVTIELHLAYAAPGPGLRPAVVYGRGDTTYLDPRALVANPHITRAEALEITEGLAVNAWLTPEGKSRWRELMTRHVGKYAAVLINAIVVTEPSVVQGDPPGVIVPERPDMDVPVTTTVPVTREQADRLARAISQTWPPAAKP
jgi:hypothetical protein